ncbi:SdpI/YhfL protein family protein [Microbacterium testaceum StLB037]|uniref:SdpI/YhfL protein family protein n=2 Tax=Microbacterium testaceum TaxID=2033 RepID=A0A1H0ME64_MICTS|nr:SdpI/YhfL protein family protein [Microbacterium testaceum StLB037]
MERTTASVCQAYPLAMSTGAIILAVVGLAFIPILALCGRGVIPRGWGVGIRLPAIQQSDAAWRAGHRAAVLPYSVFALVAVGVAVLPLAVPALSDADPALTAVVIIAGLVAGGIVGSRAADRVASDRDLRDA